MRTNLVHSVDSFDSWLIVTVDSLSRTSVDKLIVLIVCYRLYMCAYARAHVYQNKLSKLSKLSTITTIYYINQLVRRLIVCLFFNKTIKFIAITINFYTIRGFMANLREQMPATAAWIDSMREAFGVEDINAQIKKGINGGQAFHAVENGIEVGTKFKHSGNWVSPCLPVQLIDTKKMGVK